MDSSVKIKYARLLYADFISDENEEKEITSRLTEFGFTPIYSKGNAPTKFSTGKKDDFLNKLKELPKPDSELIGYIDNIFFWIYDEELLPHKTVVIEALLKTDELQKLDKSDLEDKVWKLSLHLGNCFIKNHIADHCNDFTILKFSSKAIPEMGIRNFVAEFIIEEEGKLFGNFGTELDSFEKEIYTIELKKQQITKNQNNDKILDYLVGKLISDATAQQEQKINNILSNIISMEPLSFIGDGFSSYQSIVRYYNSEMFIIGKLGQSSLYSSAPLYLITLSKEGSETPLIKLNRRPVLQTPSVRGPLDFLYGAGQILTLQLLNSWNKYVYYVTEKIINKKSSFEINTNKDIEETLEELRLLISIKAINKKISVNYLRKLNDLANPSDQTILYELLIPLKINMSNITNLEQYGMEKPGPIMSNLSSHILESVDFNEKIVTDAISLMKSKIDVLKIEEDRKYSKRMLLLTYIIVGLSIFDIILFVISVLK